jgi:glycosyltransferase involved in cell wall biosynthesis
MNRKLDKHDKNSSGARSERQNAPGPETEMFVSLLTGAADKHYAFGLAMGLVSNGVALDVIGGKDHDYPEMRGNPKVDFLDLRGNQSSNSSLLIKSLRVLVYYAKLIWYVPSAGPKIFHVLWNYKFQTFDRTLLMLYYKLFGKRVLLTVHNVNAGVRDFRDTQLNRLTLRIQYHLADHLFVHTEKMKSDLTKDFGVRATRITVIPFGINNAVKSTSLTPAEARQRMGLRKDEKVVLFFGYIAPLRPPSCCHRRRLTEGRYTGGQNGVLLQG